jgi:hypothetical protein
LITWLFEVGCPNAKEDIASLVEHGGLLMCVEVRAVSVMDVWMESTSEEKRKEKQGRGKRQTVIPFVFKKINGN